MKYVKLFSFVLVFFTFIFFVNAKLDSSFSACNTTGTAEFHLVYSGSQISFEDIKVSTLQRTTNKKFKVPGKWIYENITYFDVSKSIFPKFFSEPVFLSKGVYVVSFSINDDEAIFLMNCPGNLCKVSEECKDSDFCNSEGFCQPLVCDECEVAANHGCNKKCHDDNTCTNDVCLNGTCQNTQIENCCLTDKNCNDALLCTKDICKNFRCTHEPTICKQDECIAGVCREYTGCVYEKNTTCIKEKRKITEFLSSSFLGKILKLFNLFD